jgi:hypothetical protein
MQPIRADDAAGRGPHVKQPVPLLSPHRLALIALTLFMGLATMTSAMMHSVSSAPDRTARQDIIRISQAARLELQDLAYAAMEYRWSPATANHEHLQTAHGILLSRIEDWTKGAFGAFVETSPERIALLEAIVQHALKAESLFPRLSDPAIADALFKLVGEIEPLMAQMADQAFANDISDRVTSTKRLQLLQRLQQGLTIALFVSGLLLACLLALRKGLTTQIN